MLELKVRRQPGGAVVIVDPDGDEHVANNPAQAWQILTALMDQTTRALVKQDGPPAETRMMRRAGRRNPGETETQVIREETAEPEPDGDIVNEVLARTGAAVLDGMKSLGRSSNYRHRSRGFC